MSKSRLCHWHCGRKTNNISGICDKCWEERDRIYAERKAKEATAEKKPLSAKQESHLKKLNAARMAKLATQLPRTDIKE